MLINSRTQHEIERFCQKPTHALLLTGERGSGLNFIAQYVTTSLDSQAEKELVTTQILADDKGTIGIDAIRELRSGLKHKNEGSKIARVVIINSIEAMQAEAQNALLKLLEEPPVGTLFILLSHSESRVLSTISSRAVHIAVLPISSTVAANYFEGVDSTKLAKMLALSNGLPRLLVELMNNEESLDVTDAARAKELLSMTAFQRLSTIDKEFKKREAASTIIGSLERVCHAALLANPNKTSWQHNLHALVHAKKLLTANVQPKLVLSELFINIK